MYGNQRGLGCNDRMFLYTINWWHQFLTDLWISVPVLDLIYACSCYSATTSLIWSFILAIKGATITMMDGIVLE